MNFFSRAAHSVSDNFISSIVPSVLMKYGKWKGLATKTLPSGKKVKLSSGLMDTPKKVNMAKGVSHDS